MLLVQIKIMPASVETDLEKIKAKAKEIVEGYEQKILKDEIQPIAFGLNALLLIISWPDDKGADELEEKIAQLDEVKSANIVDVRRAIG